MKIKKKDLQITSEGGTLFVNRYGGIIVCDNCVQAVHLDFET